MPSHFSLTRRCLAGCRPAGIPDGTLVGHPPRMCLNHRRFGYAERVWRCWRDSERPSKPHSDLMTQKSQMFLMVRIAVLPGARRVRSGSARFSRATSC
jgi:hypothetical protein